MSTSESRKPANPSAAAQRYLFETSFDSDRAADNEPPPEPTYGPAELQQAREAGYAEGEAAGRQDAVNSIEKQMLNGLGRLVEQMGALSDSQARYQRSLTERSVELALKAVQKTFPALAQRDGLVEIEALLADCLREARAEARIQVQVSDTLAESFRERIDELAAKAGYQGIVTVLADDALGPADCRVEWADGGAERIAQNMWREFEAAAQRVFDSARDDIPPEQPDEPPPLEPGPGPAPPPAPAGPDDPPPIDGLAEGSPTGKADMTDMADPAGDPPGEPTEPRTDPQTNFAVDPSIADLTEQPPASDATAADPGGTKAAGPSPHPATAS